MITERSNSKLYHLQAEAVQVSTQGNELECTVWQATFLVWMTEMVSWSYWFLTVNVAECYGQVPYSGAAPEHQEWSQTKPDCVHIWCLRTVLEYSTRWAVMWTLPFYRNPRQYYRLFYSKTKVDTGCFRGNSCFATQNSQLRSPF